MSLLQEQPAPVQAEGDVWAEIIAETDNPRMRALFQERRAQGLERYGVPLQRENGRDHRADAVQELVDAIVYFRAGDDLLLQKKTEELLLLALGGR